MLGNRFDNFLHLSTVRYVRTCAPVVTELQGTSAKSMCTVSLYKQSWNKVKHLIK